ncbi:MAG: hypothetical protein IMZ60_02510 [Actinobacteria bacterium]|nr:hypothetical protein [Actinomycetota bacterium]
MSVINNNLLKKLQKINKFLLFIIIIEVIAILVIFYLMYSADKNFSLICNVNRELFSPINCSKHLPIL